MSSLLLIALFVLGILYCFCGLKTRKLALAIMFFSIGYSLGGVLALAVGNPDLIGVLGIVVAVILILLIFKFEKIFVCIYLFNEGFQLVESFFDTDVGTYFFLAMVVGVLLAALSFKLFKVLLILSTAIRGGLVLAIISTILVPALAPFELIITIGLIALGTIFQFSDNRNMTLDGRTSLS